MAHKNSKLFDAIFIRPSDGSGSEDDESETTSDENLEEPAGLSSEDQNISISSLGLQNGLKLPSPIHARSWRLGKKEIDA